MEKININNFKEKLYYEKLENGLEVYFVPLKNKNNYTCMMGTKYGGRDIKFKVDGKLVETPTGIAHFLEHKMFEKEENPFMFYQKSGTDVNASTSHECTNYYITGNKNFNKNLIYLLNWIKDLEIDDELVEKERGIILEEANMYKDAPNRVLNEKIKANVFRNDPFKNKVIGTDEDIKSITKEQLELCYKSFYTPENMYLICVGNFDYKKALKIVEEHTENFENSKNKIEKYYEKEDDAIQKEYEEVYLNVDLPRVSVAYKINKKLVSDLEVSPFKFDLYLHMLMNIGLGLTSSIREKWLREKLFVNAQYRITEIATHYVIELIATSDNEDELIKKAHEYLKDIQINEEDFERQKKMWIASEVKGAGNIHNIQYGILDDILDYGCFVNDKITQINDMNFETLKEIKERVKFDNRIIVKILPKSYKSIVN